MALKFPSPSFRVGTIRDSFYSIYNRIEYLAQNGQIKYKELGPSPDGKVTNEFHIFPTDGTSPFAIYDYKFGLDPSDDDNFEEEFNFSIGGSSKDAETSARELGFEVVSEQLNEDFQTKWKKFMKEEVSFPIGMGGPDSNLAHTISQALFQLQDEPGMLLSKYKESLTNDIRLNGPEKYENWTVEDFIADYEDNAANWMDY